jgi:hypothetical protein
MSEPENITQHNEELHAQLRLFCHLMLGSADAADRVMRQILWVPDTRPHVLTWGDASRMGFGTMGGRDVATRVPDLPAADLLGCSARAFRRIQGR